MNAVEGAPSADAGRRLERRRQAERFRDPADPTRGLISRFDTLEWTAPLKFPTFKSHNRLLLDAAKKSRVIKREVGFGYRAFTRNGAVVGGFHNLTTSLTSDLGKAALGSKASVKAHLETMEVATPAGRGFAAEDREGALLYFRELSAPVTVKSSVTDRGQSTSTDVRDEHSFLAAWELAQVKTKPTAGVPAQIIVEKYFSGISVRAYVVGEAVIGAAARLPLFITGDGTSSVLKLAEDAREARNLNSYLAQSPPDISAESLAELGLKAEEVLAEGDMRNISGTSNPGAGGMTLDITSRLSESHRRLAVDALWAIPGVRAGGVDLLISDLPNASEAVATDVTDTADMSLHRYPAFGAWRTPAADIIDQMLISAAH